MPHIQVLYSSPGKRGSVPEAGLKGREKISKKTEKTLDIPVSKCYISQAPHREAETKETRQTTEKLVKKVQISGFSRLRVHLVN